VGVHQSKFFQNLSLIAIFQFGREGKETVVYSEFLKGKEDGNGGYLLGTPRKPTQAVADFQSWGYCLSAAHWQESGRIDRAGVRAETRRALHRLNKQTVEVDKGPSICRNGDKDAQTNPNGVPDAPSDLGWL
jgi:hypothetical protein